MRIIPFVISIVITGALIFALNTKWGSIPPLGKFLSPQQGFWQNAEPVDADFNEELSFTGLKGRATVYLDDRLVPHVFADNEPDAYFLEGYIHAKYRLWQMDFNSRAASGRLSEILGNNPQLVNYDRQQRRMGMVYGAENNLKAVAQDPVMQEVYDAYTAGVNAYISQLTAANMPLEFKLLDYKPEPWTNLKIALFVKLMSSDLAGQQYARDIAFSNERSVFSEEELKILYPEVQDSLVPIIPVGTTFAAPSVNPQPPAGADSLYFSRDSLAQPVPTPKPTDMNGSNNWAVSGSKTASGAPILCNDPHLRLTLPSIWFEMQLHTPQMNAYGATFASVPGVVIGFNDHIAWGVTNAGRDVIDYYKIRFRDDSRKEYWYNGAWQPTEMRAETIHIRGAADLQDTVAYTDFGPVLYDQRFSYSDDSTHATSSALAMRWIAHDVSNDGRMWYDLNRATNYDEYVQALKNFACPAQNVLFAAKDGDIAIWQQGRYPARWQGQGLYVMPGEDSSYQWQAMIPMEENPHVRNPPQGFLQSANQRAVDSTYPYFIPGDYITPRGVSVYTHLDTMTQITPKDMMALQQDTYSTLAADALPLLLRNTWDSTLNASERNYLSDVQQWNYRVDAESKAATIYQTWMDSLRSRIWHDEFARSAGPVAYPNEQTLVECLLRDSAFRFVDDVNTPVTETLPQQVTASFKSAVAALLNEEPETGLLWWKHKDMGILHLLRESLLPLGRTALKVGGWGNVINAITKTSGPSWRMIVHLTGTTEAYGVYPGGQSGNPGSKYYDNYIDKWVKGEYFPLWMMKEDEKNDKRVIATIHFNKG
ncbi:MAG: penicillin acylase family protein [Flavisolibacter sp.]